MTKSVINLTRGVPPVNVFPVKDLIECGEAALRQDPSVLLQYSHAGYTPLREWLGKQYDVGPERILTGNSSLEVFYFITQVLLAPGKRAFVESPSYDRAITLLRRAGAEIVGIPLEEDGVNLEALEAELEKGAPALMYVIADFQNPMGVTTSLEKRERLAALAEEYDFWIIEDAPYRKLRYWGEDVSSLRLLSPDRVLHMSSFSKILSPGLRLGYVVGPAETVAALRKWAEDSHIGPVLPTQGMVYEYCRRGLLEANIEHLKAVYRPRLEAILSALDEHIPQATWTRPEGGFFVSGILPARNDITDLRERAAGAGLKLSDGRGFFPNPEDGNRFLRIPFCSLTPEEIEEGISRLAGLL
ncbi:MAG TPA: PLP-dependent aminotransferase family protein, partial [Thermoflexia bacterium]|nr:PLP-dependent aminotransferase family protein [Thermoflexia bacterium]